MGKKKSLSTRRMQGKPPFWKKISFGTIIFLVVMGFVVYSMTARTIENFLLARYGMLEKGVVVRKLSVGAKGTIRVVYRFNASNQEYEGYTNNEEYEEGDTINILYLKNKPGINRTYSFIKNNYSTDIKVP